MSPVVAGGGGEVARPGLAFCAPAGGAAVDGVALGAAAAGVEALGAPMNRALTSNAGAVAFIGAEEVGVDEPLALALTETAGAAAAVDGAPLVTTGGRPPAAAASSVPN